jgi:hypothetical protein
MNKNYKQFAGAILSILGLDEWSKSGGAYGLTDGQRTILQSCGFTDEWIEGFHCALSDDFAGGEGSPPLPNDSPADGSIELGRCMAQLVQALSDKSSLEAQLQQANADRGVIDQERTALNAKIASLQRSIAVLSERADDDPGAGASHGGNAGVRRLNWQDEHQLGGLPGALFGMDKPYNCRARAAMLAMQGVYVGSPMASADDYSDIQDTLGKGYKQLLTPEVLTFYTPYKRVTDIFPLRTDVQDEGILVDLLLSEISQPDNSGSSFDSVAKGAFKFQAEKLKMRDIMVAMRFEDLKSIESEWIGYLNTDGSSSVKMGFVQFILAKVMEKVLDEQNNRYIKGVYVEPEKNKPGSYLDGIDGFYQSVSTYVKRRQVLPFNLGVINATNIADKVYKGTSQVPDRVRNSGKCVLYMPEDMIPQYLEAIRIQRGQDSNYKGEELRVAGFNDVRIIGVPYAGQHRRLVWTWARNFRTYQNVPNEMFRFRFHQHEFSVNVVSQWKESIQATLVGRKFKANEKMHWNEQAIFCSDVDLPEESYVPVRADNATPSVAVHTSIVSVSNTSLLTISDIQDAVVGQEVRIKCGSVSQGIRILNGGNFQLDSDWTPNEGDILVLMKIDSGKFVEIGRKTEGAAEIFEFSANDTTPSLLNGTVFSVGVNTASTVITNFLNATPGQIYKIYGNGSTYASTMANGGKFILTAAMTLSTGKWIELICREDYKFVEKSRGV